MDYGTPERRKSKNDKRAKARYNRYKKGGALRVVDREKDRERTR